MKKRTCTKKVFTKRNVGIAFMLSAAFSLLLMPINAQALVRSAFNASLLADRDSIVLDDGEYWCEQSFNHRVISPTGPYVLIACNSSTGINNVLRNHYGLHNSVLTEKKEVGHAWSFSLQYYADKQAYTVETEMPYFDDKDWLPDYHYMEFAKCNFAWWNLAGKKTEDGTKIQSWTDGANKAENLFWVSYNPATQRYRIWSALAGKPVGYTADDSDNLKLVNPSNKTASTYFVMNEIPREIPK